MDISMTDAEAAAFLADVHVGILAIEHEGHPPLAVPIWYQYEDGEVIIGTDGDSLKAKLLRAAGRASLTVQTETAPYRYVSVEGPVTVAPGQRDDVSMASRYLGPEVGRWYAATNPNTETSVVVRLTPQRWRTADFSKPID